MQCPRCGGNLPQAGGPCPACAWSDERQVQQAPVPVAKDRATGPGVVAFPDPCKSPATPAPEVPVPYPDTDRMTDHGKSTTKVGGDEAMPPSSDVPPSEGDEPGTGGPWWSVGGLPGGANPLLVAGIVVVVVVVVATIYLLAGDAPNGHEGPGPDEGLLIDPIETSVVNVWEPTPGFHLSVVISNNATGPMSLDGHDLLVTVLVGTEEVGRATVAVSGDLAPGHGRGVLIDVGVDLTTGQRYKVDVLLRKDGGSTTVDVYRTEVTIEQS